jgi:tRNA(Ile)-lysidine synthetase-like protein
LSRDRLPDRLQVRARAGGDVFSRPHTGHRTELRKFLQDQGILPWRRYSIPLLLANDEVVAVGDLAVGTRWAARPGEASFRVIWHPRPLLCAADFTSRPIPSPSDTV